MNILSPCTDLEVAETAPAAHRAARPSLGRRIAAATLTFIREVRDFLAGPVPVPTPAAALRSVRRTLRSYAYSGRHRCQATALGRERSTAEFTGAAQRRAREPRSEEGDLVFQPGDTFASHLALCIEAIREHDRALHPTHSHLYRAIGRAKVLCS